MKSQPNKWHLVEGVLSNICKILIGLIRIAHLLSAMNEELKHSTLTYHDRTKQNLKLMTACHHGLI